MASVVIATARTHSRGHLIVWRYEDSGEVLDNERPCIRCGEPPTPEGHDACVGHLPGAVSVCCGHGVSEPILMTDEEL